MQEDLSQVLLRCPCPSLKVFLNYIGLHGQALKRILVYHAGKLWHFTFFLLAASNPDSGPMLFSSCVHCGTCNMHHASAIDGCLNVQSSILYRHFCWTAGIQPFCHSAMPPPPRFRDPRPDVPAVKAPPAMAHAEWVQEQSQRRLADVRRRVAQGLQEGQVSTTRLEQDLRDAINDEKLARARLRASHVRYILPEPMYDGQVFQRSRSAPSFLRHNEAFRPVLPERVWNAGLRVWEVNV